MFSVDGCVVGHKDKVVHDCNETRYCKHKDSWYCVEAHYVALKLSKCRAELLDFKRKS